MTPGLIRSTVVIERVVWIRRMLDSMRQIPAGSIDEFLADDRNAASMESYLRRTLEALFDLGRHILAKGFAEGILEYKGIAEALSRNGVLSKEESAHLVKMAGYRNRMTHFYAEVTGQELYSIRSGHLDEIDALVDSLLVWLRSRPERLDTAL